ncbi:uncharacterized protein [Medicago truncatula]|uniref:uncharacterized protein n=1 Tax=Medicago truncatula TaxID=3880 RepID=UPI0019677A8D|nr:uncharacterized protein LOC112418636 [Medicago truncatula]
MHTRLASWKSKLLNKPGRLALATSVLSSIPAYYMQINWLPESICDSIDQTTRNFIWRGHNDKGIHLVGWKKIAKPKNLGGLGIRSAREANTCSGSSSFWFSHWSGFGCLGAQTPIIDIHDLHLFVKEVLNSNGNRAQALYTNLPQDVTDFINNASIKFNDAIEDAFIWHHNKNGVYTTKSGYKWLLSQSGSANNSNHSWSWIWRFKVPEKYKFLIWLACNNVVPTLSMLNHRNIASSPTCSRCGLHDETFFHCMRDCNFSRDIWHNIGFNDSEFFAMEDATDWLREGTKGPHATTFAAGLWWTWMCQNSMCLSNEQMSVHKLTANIRNSAKDIELVFPSTSAIHMDRYIRWNNNNLNSNILNVDGSCIGTPARAGFGGLIRNSAGYYITGFSGFIPASADILLAELTAIYHGLTIAKDLGLAAMACYSDSLLAINTVKETSSKYHVYAVLIHEIKILLSQDNASLHHTLREGNQCADFLPKLGASSDDILLAHPHSPNDLRPLLRTNALGTLFLRS